MLLFSRILWTRGIDEVGHGIETGNLYFRRKLLGDRNCVAFSARG
jgi:hypothetical protein